MGQRRDEQRGLSRSHLLSMRHTRKSFISNEGGPEAPPLEHSN